MNPHFGRSDQARSVRLTTLLLEILRDDERAQMPELLSAGVWYMLCQCSLPQPSTAVLQLKAGVLGLGIAELRTTSSEPIPHKLKFFDFLT